MKKGQKCDLCREEDEQSPYLKVCYLCGRDIEGDLVNESWR